MASGEREARESRAAEPELITDPQLKAEAEAANGLRQYDYAVKSVYEALERQPFKLRVSRITSFQREALQGCGANIGDQRKKVFGNVTRIMRRGLRSKFRARSCP